MVAWVNGGDYRVVDGKVYIDYRATFLSIASEVKSEWIVEGDICRVKLGDPDGPEAPLTPPLKGNTITITRDK